MKLNRKARWLIILILLALLTTSGAGMAAAAGNQHGFRWRDITTPGNLSSALQPRWRSHEDLGPDDDILDGKAIEAAAANALGVSPEEMQSAIQAGWDSFQPLLDAAGLELADLKSVMDAEVESQLAAAVEEGTLTQEEMDAILSHNHGRMGPWHGRRGRFDEQIPQTGAIDAQAVLQAAAAGAGLDAEELLAVMTEDRSALEAFLEANDTTPAEFRAALDNARQQAIADAVEAGTLTTEEANRLNRTRSLWDDRHRGKHGYGWSGGISSRGPPVDNA